MKILLYNIFRILSILYSNLACIQNVIFVSVSRTKPLLNRASELEVNPWHITTCLQKSGGKNSLPIKRKHLKQPIELLTDFKSESNLMKFEQLIIHSVRRIVAKKINRTNTEWKKLTHEPKGKFSGRVEGTEWAHSVQGN